MKTKITLLLLYLFLISGAASAQVSTANVSYKSWSKIENVTAPIRVNTDGDNGDGVADGAMLLKSTATTPALQGLQCLLSGTAVDGQQLNLESTYYQATNSYLSFKIQVYNVTDSAVLAETAVITVLGNATAPATSTLSYTFTGASVGDQIAIRYVRADDNNTVRQIGIDYLKVNGQFASMQAPLAVFNPSIYGWSKIEGGGVAKLSNDADNGDGANDGAILLKSLANTPAVQGLQCALSGTPNAGEQINIQSTYYQNTVSYLSFKIQVYNVTDSTVLTESPNITVLGNATAPATTILSFVFPASSAGDQIMIRYLRTDDNNPTRQIGIDNLKINGQFVTMEAPVSSTPACSMPAMNPDLPLLASNATVETEINTIIERYSDSYLGTAEPSATALNAAIASYNALNITVDGYAIKGNISTYEQASFIKTFAQYLKFHPEDTDNIYTKALNTVWLVADAVCKGSIALEYNQYSYSTFAKGAILIPRIKDNAFVKSLFESMMYRQNNFDYMWGSISNNIGYNIDHVGNTGVVTMAYVKWIDSADERYRYMTGFKRQMEKFMSYTPGTNDGIKPDGSTFHHWAAYPGYTYNLNAEANIVYLLRETSFQVNKESYLRLRDAIMAQLMLTNDKTTRVLLMSGRNPNGATTNINQYQFREMAVAGGSIMNTGTSDPVMATLYNRIWGTTNPYTSQFGNSTKATFNEGYFQFNHSAAGIYRKDNWVVTYKGFDDSMFGAEIYASTNRFGRYQSYGAVNIVYDGDAPTGNGYDYTTWNWNYNPGTTVIRLPWDKLHGEKENIDELQQKSFAGSLSFINKNSEFLKTIHGTYGMFAMDFQERTGLGYGIVHGTESHNATFTFKKSVFTFDNMLICLGSGISNNDGTNPTVTTLYQRKAFAGRDQVSVDSNLLSIGSYDNSYDDTTNHWIVDNYGTGFYVFSGSGTIKLSKADQQTPQYNQLWSAQNIANNPAGNYAIGYIDHGMAPSNKGYEYVCMPKTTGTDMTALGSQIDAGNKPYTVHRKDEMAHIVEYKPTANANAIFGYSFFSALSGLNNTGQLTGADFPCLVMSQYDKAQKSLKLAVNNPDLGFTWRQATPSVDKQINITVKGTNWQISQPNSRASITGTTNGETTIQFTVVDGLPVEIVLSRVLTPQTIGFEALPAKKATDAAFDLTATASSNLPVTYTSSNTEVATISGNTVTIVGKGAATITAKQDGDDIYEVAEAVEQTLTVNPAAQTITFDAIPTKAISDTAFDLTATASSNLPVTYTSSNTDVATISGSTLTIVGKGTTTITASQEGNTIYDIATAVDQILRVNTEATVSITSPLANASYTALANITITADAADVDGSVSKVEFFNGTTKLGEDVTAPYSFDWNNVAAGNYALTAKVTDNDGAVTTSAVVTIDVVCPTVQLSIPDVYAMNPAIDDKNTIYIGYGPTSLTLNSLVQGDQDVTYTWSTGELTPSISVSEAGTYTVTVSYAGGCQSTASITINSLDVRCGNDNTKVQICHNNTIICVAQSAAQGHLDHGDNLGSCNGTLKIATKDGVTNSSSFTVYPNPVQDNFNVSVSSKLDPNATIGIYNILGNKIRQVRFSTVPQNVFAGDLPSGNYIVVVQNGVETFRSTIVKQ